MIVHHIENHTTDAADEIIDVVDEIIVDDVVVVGGDAFDVDVDGLVTWIDDLVDDDAVAARTTYDPPTVVRTDNHPL